MKQIVFLINNEKGSLILVSMVILVILTLIGIAATNTSNLEIQITANDREYKTTFYNADSGISWAVATFNENDVDPVNPFAPVPNMNPNPLPGAANQFPEELAAGDGRPVPLNAPYSIYYRREVPPIGLDPVIIEIQSFARLSEDLNSDGRWDQGNISVIAAIQLPTPPGPPPPPGGPGMY